jgi:hypothetical protein
VFREDERCNESNPYAGQADHIRNDLVIQVDDRNDNETRQKQEIEKIAPGNPEPGEQKEGTDCGHPFHKGILQRDRDLTIATFCPEQEVADQRDIVIERN